MIPWCFASCWRQSIFCRSRNSSVSTWRWMLLSIVIETGVLDKAYTRFGWASVSISVVFFEKSLCEWRTMLLVRHAVVQSNLSSTLSDYSRSCERMQQAMVASQALKRRPILCEKQPRFEKRELEDLMIRVGLYDLTWSMIQSWLRVSMSWTNQN